MSIHLFILYCSNQLRDNPQGAPEAPAARSGLWVARGLSEPPLAIQNEFLDHNEIYGEHRNLLAFGAI